MGPTTLFDKSFLQSLSVDESVWFDQYFIANVCPVFFIETLADLRKTHLRVGRTPEQEVAIIAEKTPEGSQGVNVHHRELCMAELHGFQVPNTGQIPIRGGRPVSHNGKVGVVIDESPEALAFSRWQEGKFLDVERLVAHGWREMLTNLDLGATASGMRAMGIQPAVCNSLDDAYALAVNRQNY